jgi:hypothetical protein
MFVNLDVQIHVWEPKCHIRKGTFGAIVASFPVDLKCARDAYEMHALAEWYGLTQPMLQRQDDKRFRLRLLTSH